MTEIINMKSFLLFLFLLVQLSMEESSVSAMSVTTFATTPSNLSRTSDPEIPNLTSSSSTFAVADSGSYRNETLTDHVKNTESPRENNSYIINDNPPSITQDHINSRVTANTDGEEASTTSGQPSVTTTSSKSTTSSETTSPENTSSSEIAPSDTTPSESTSPEITTFTEVPSDTETTPSESPSSPEITSSTEVPSDPETTPTEEPSDPETTPTEEPSDSETTPSESPSSPEITSSTEVPSDPETTPSETKTSSEAPSGPETTPSETKTTTEAPSDPETTPSETKTSTKVPTDPGIPITSPDPETSAVTEDSTSPSTTDLPTSTEGEIQDGTNVGLVIGIILPIILVGVGIVLWRAYRAGVLQWPPKNLFPNGFSGSVRPQPVSIKKFPAHCNDMLDVPSKLSHEYQLLATLSVDIYAMETFAAGQLPENKYKNRYVNILPFDSTRVKLAPGGDNFYSDYINASYVKGYTNEIEYIATQGPKEDTCRDFWNMVHQEPIKVIVMVTQLEEQGKPKCYKYFPNLRENLELEDILVRCTTELHFPIYTSRTLILSKGEKKRSITHLHFREWPDFGCPATPDLMLQFSQVMRHNIVLVQPGITLIHCSAGVGRTGTLIAVDILLQQIKENKKIDIFGTVYKLRKHRMNMVQSEAQYVYLYKCIKEALEDPSYLSSENSSTTSLEPIYENIECTRISLVTSKNASDTISESECTL